MEVALISFPEGVILKRLIFLGRPRGPRGTPGIIFVIVIDSYTECFIHGLWFPDDLRVCIPLGLVDFSRFVFLEPTLDDAFHWEVV